MDHFRYRDGKLFCEELKVDDLACEFGTPLFIYSARSLREHYQGFTTSFAEISPLVCFSIKSCSNVHILRLLVEAGSGMDVVTGGELFRAQQAGTPMGKVVYAGVGKTSREIAEALEAKIGWFNVESSEEAQNIIRIARRTGSRPRVALRVNPDVFDPKTPDKTATGRKATKFGVDLENAVEFFEEYGRNDHIDLAGLHFHLGSPIYTSGPYVDAIQKTLTLMETLKRYGHSIEMIDIGGGFTANYEDENAAGSWDDFAKDIVPLLKPFVAQGGRIVAEPGRTICANTGVLVSQVQYVKYGGGKKFVVVDTGMSHLIRPTLYGGFHFIWPTDVVPTLEPMSRLRVMEFDGLEACDVVGPICESSDFLGKDRPLPKITRGENLCIFTAGSYGMVMASQYNAIPRPPEILVDGNSAELIRRRETYEDLIEAETFLQSQASMPAER